MEKGGAAEPLAASGGRRRGLILLARSILWGGVFWSVLGGLSPSLFRESLPLCDKWRAPVSRTLLRAIETCT